jgi:uncharacterized protein (DUF58 family)
VALTGRTAALALAGALIVLAFRSVTGLILVEGLLAAGIVVDLLLAAPVRKLRLTRSGDTKVRLSETAVVTLTIANPSGRPLRAQLRDAWPPSAGAAPRTAPVALAGGGSAQVRTALTPSRRGDAVAATVTIRSSGPLGLAARQASRPVPWRVRALPPFRSRRHLPEKLARLRELDGQHRSLRRGQGSEFDSLREYVVGDDVRSIDWRGTARHSEVLVRTWRPERDRRILVLLDTGRTVAGRVGDAPRLDAAMDAVQLLTALAARAGDRLDLIAMDRRIRARVVGTPRSAVLAAVTDAMAPLNAELVEPDGAAMAENLLPHVALLASRHQLLVGAVADPRVDELAAGRGEAGLVYTAAAAERARAERAQVAAELQRRGAVVVDAPPERLPPALANAYLALKAAGRL